MFTLLLLLPGNRKTGFPIVLPLKTIKENYFLIFGWLPRSTRSLVKIYRRRINSQVLRHPLEMIVRIVPFALLFGKSIETLKNYIELLI